MNKMKNNFKSDKSQYEMFGFMIIVIMVVIVSVIFLGIYLKPKVPIAGEDALIGNFLSAATVYTTECFKDSEPNYRTLHELVKDCYLDSQKECGNGEKSCVVLNRTYSEMLKRAFVTGQGASISYYLLRADYYLNTSDSSTRQNNILTISSGNNSFCAAKKAETAPISLDSGGILVRLEICKNS